MTDSDTFPTSLLTSFGKLQHLLSKGRHRAVLLELEQEVTVDVPVGNASTPAQRTLRAEGLQLSHIATAGAAPAGKDALGSHTGAILNLVPIYPGKEVNNGAFRLFIIHMLRLWPDTTIAPGPYRTKCPLCDKDIFNFHVHALSCNKISGIRRHDKSLEPVVHAVTKVGCDAPHVEPSGTDPDSDSRPDVEFRMTNTNVACGYDVVKIGKYNCADISFAKIAKELIIQRVSPPESERPWIPRRQAKEQKHSIGPHVCLPIVASVLGALDPYFTKWLVDAVANAPASFRDTHGKLDVRQFFSKFLVTVWKENYYMYDKYISRLSGVEDISESALPPRLA